MVLPTVSDDRGLRGFEVGDRGESLAGLLGRAETSDETVKDRLISIKLKYRIWKKKIKRRNLNLKAEA